MGDDLEVLSHALEAEVNLVVSSVDCAPKYLEKNIKCICSWDASRTFTEEIVQALEKKERYPYKRLREENSDKRATGKRQKR